MSEHSEDRYLDRELKEILARQSIAPDTYSYRLRLLRAGLIIPIGGVTAFAGLYLTVPLTEIFPFPLSIVAPVASGLVSFIAGIVAGEIVLIAVDKLVPNTGK